MTELSRRKKKDIGTLKHADIFSQFNRELIQNALIRPVAKDDDLDFLKLLKKLSEFHNSIAHCPAICLSKVDTWEVC